MVHTYENCSSLRNVIIPNSVITIGGYAFYGCESLLSVSIGKSVTSIGYGALYGCSSLTDIIIPASVTSIGSNAFGGCSDLLSITSLNSTPPTIRNGCFTNKQYLNAVLYVPQEAISAYQTADNWKNFWEIQAVKTDGIESVETVLPDCPTAIYDLQGRMLTEPQRGINIIGGKKVVIRK